MAGHCPSCGADIYTIVNGRTKKLPTYSEHILKLSNWTLMRVGVCADCKTELVAGKSMLTAKKIVANHKLYWRKAKKAPKNFENLDCMDSNSNPKKFLKERAMEIHLHKKLI